MADLRNRVGSEMRLGVLVWFADGRIVARGGAGDAGAMARAYADAGTDLLVAVLAAGTDTQVVIDGMKRFMDAATTSR
jgi:hypothetical protein